MGVMNEDLSKLTDSELEAEFNRYKVMSETGTPEQRLAFSKRRVDLGFERLRRIEERHSE